MSDENTFIYKGFQLNCDPMPMADGRFGAQVLVLEGETTLQAFLFPALAYFPTEKEAVEHGEQTGIRWIEENRR